MTTPLHPVRSARTLWKFSRPHAFVGTLTSIVGLFGIAVSRGEFGWPELGGLGWALASCLAAAVFIVGLNQYTDVPIDRINKPDLPMAAGELSVAAARLLLAALLVVSVTLAYLGGVYLLLTVAVSTAVGVAYSVPPLRLKRYPALAAACIMFVRGLVIPVGLYLHFAAVAAAPVDVPAVIWLLCAFTLAYSASIAWLKDIPDVQGDSSHDQRTFAQSLGPRTVFRIGLAALSIAFGMVVVAGLVGLPGVHGPFLAGTQVALLLLIWIRSRPVDLGRKPSVVSFYLFVWAIFQLEYPLFAVACLLPLG